MMLYLEQWDGIDREGLRDRSDQRSFQGNNVLVKTSWCLEVYLFPHSLRCISIKVGIGMLTTYGE